MPYRYVFAIAAATLVVALAQPAQATAETLSFSQRLAIYRACKPDLDRNCPDAGTNAGRIRACLTAHQQSLTQACRTTIRSTGAR